MKILEAISAFFGACWFFYKWYKTRDFRFILISLFALFVLLSRWPFLLPIKFSFSLASFFAAFSIFFENYKKEKVLKSTVYFYILLFVAFGILFFVEAFFLRCR